MVAFWVRSVVVFSNLEQIFALAECRVLTQSLRDERRDGSCILVFSFFSAGRESELAWRWYESMLSHLIILDPLLERILERETYQRMGSE